MAAPESHRGWHALILEAELLASSPEYVYHWFEERATAKDGHPYTSLDASLDVEIQQALLRCGHPLIDLALARFTGEHEIAFALFHRADTRSNAEVAIVGNVERERSDSALRLAILANRILGVSLSWGDPPALRLIADSVSWLGTASSNEIIALFSNPTLSDGFLLECLEGSAAWTALSDEHRIEAVCCLTRNANLRQEYDGDDGWAHARRGQLHQACWALAETAPITNKWALALSSLYEELRPNVIKGDASRWLNAATRWVSPGGEKENDRWDSFKAVRFHLARLVIACYPDIGADLLTHGDIAMRSAAYECSELAQEQLAEAFERDKELAYDHLVRNDSLWRNPQTRNILGELERKAKQTVDEAGGDSFYTVSSYSDCADAMRKKHPHWFKEDEVKYTEDEIESDLPSVSDEPATKADLRAVAETVMMGNKETQALLPKIEKLGATVDGVRHDLVVAVGFVIVLLLLMLWRG